MRNRNEKNAKQAIYSALVELMESEEYEDISITDIAKKAGVSRMTYYRNYKEKDDILLDRFKELLDDKYSGLISTAKAMKGNEAWKALAHECAKNALTMTIVRAGLFEYMIRYTEGFLTKVYQEVFDYDMQDPRNRIMMHACVGAVSGLILYSIHNPDDVDVPTGDRIIEAVTEMGHEISQENLRLRPGE